jgi:hypothetical protein
MNLAEHASLGGDTSFHENDPEISDPEQPEDEDRDGLGGIHNSGDESLSQARLTEEQAEELRQRASGSSFGTPS